jgi:hypothetical protein
MEDFIRVNVGGDILDLSVDEFSKPKKRFWFDQVAFTGNDPRLEARMHIAWQRYCSLSGQVFHYGLSTLKRGAFRFWLRCSLTRLGVI